MSNFNIDCSELAKDQLNNLINDPSKRAVSRISPFFAMSDFER